MFSRRVWATVRVHADGLVTRHARRAAPLKGGDPMTNRDHLAHSVGFEPTDVSAYGFQDRCHKPLDQLCMNPRITRPGTALVFLRPRTSPPTSGGGAVKSRSPRPLIPLPVIHRVAQPVRGTIHRPLAWYYYKPFRLHCDALKRPYAIGSRSPHFISRRIQKNFRRAA